MKQRNVKRNVKGVSKVEGGCMADWKPGEKAAWDKLSLKQKKVEAKKNLRQLLAQMGIVIVG